MGKGKLCLITHGLNAIVFINFPTVSTMKTLRIMIPGIPMGKGAARHSKKGFTYTPTKTRNYMAELKDRAIQAGAEPLDCPVISKIDAYFPIPKSYSNKKAKMALQGELKYVKKPDRDNLSKCLDALNGVAFRDDALIWRETISKYYSTKPRLEITLIYENET